MLAAPWSDKQERLIDMVTAGVAHGLVVIIIIIVIIVNDTAHGEDPALYIMRQMLWEMPSAVHQQYGFRGHCHGY